MFRYLLLLFIPCLSLAQSNKEYQGLLWKISGNGLDEPSYLYGTMHVSNRVAFHLSETFFNALDSAEIVALETNPETWVKDLTSSKLYRDFFQVSYSYSQSQYPLYRSFVPQEPLQTQLEYYLARDQDVLNGLLYRLNQYDQDFSENTYLDLFIYQAGKKNGKKIVPLEDYEQSFKHVLMSGRPDQDAVQITNRQAKNLLGNFSSWQALMEDAYRRGDLDLIDTINTSLYPGKYYRKYMLNLRNKIMVEGMDSLMQTGTLFTGVGAAHLPGDSGVINLLRERGYTVVAEDRSITSNSIARKDSIDEVIFDQEMNEFSTDDGFITTTAPGEMVKFLSQPYQEYVFADMANGGFYSIRRVSTYGEIYGKDQDNWRAKIDSLLFENIPGKILSKDTMEISGYPAYDIRNKTKTGDHQHYQIIFTPLEVIIFKAGGHQEFALSAQPESFFDSIQLNHKKEETTYSPRFGGFEVNLPGSLQTEKYEAAFFNPDYTFWAESYDKSGSYYAAALRQYHDFDYLEEDEFELRHFVTQMAEDDLLEVDTLYLLQNGGYDFTRFELSNKKDQKLYGEIHLEGPKYVMLLTNNTDSAGREDYFDSFSFTPWQYQDDFREYRDSVMHLQMSSPVKLNDYTSFISSFAGYGYNNEEDHSYRGAEESKTITYEPTGEQLKLQFQTLHKYASYPDLESFWENHLNELQEENSCQLVHNEVLYTKDDSSYLSQAREIHFSDTNTHRLIRMKIILENGAIYSLTANVDSLDYSSRFVDEAFASFTPAEDTIIGQPVTVPKSGLFFDALESRDSTAIFEASNSVYEVGFVEKDANRIKEVISHYQHPQFDRYARLNLLNRLSWLNDDPNIPYLEELYFKYMDSSAYQFEILETLVDFNTKRGNKSFLELIMEEPPFTSNTYSYSSLMSEFEDSLELAPILFPEILALTDFVDYRSSIYELLTTLVDSGLVKKSDYRSKYKTILLFAKVELKKQLASDGGPNSRITANDELLYYTKLLKPFAHKKEVREHFARVLKVRNQPILADLLLVVDPYISIPDSTWNYVASDPRGLYTIYPYLRDEKELKSLDPRYRTPHALAKSYLLSNRYSTYDSVSFIRSEAVEIKPYAGQAYFFRAKDNDDKLWKLLYLVAREEEGFIKEVAVSQEGEEYNEKLDDLDEIIEDTLKQIKLYDRQRATYQNEYNAFY